MHSTADGYRAITATLARWSVSEPALQPIRRLDPGASSMPRLGDPLGAIALIEHAAGTGGTYTITSDKRSSGGPGEVMNRATSGLDDVLWASPGGSGQL